MSTNSTENTGTEQPNSDATQQTNSGQPSQEQVDAAVKQNLPDASSMTPDQFLTEIRALPERIVDALKEATASSTTSTTTAPPVETEQVKSGLFNGKTLSEWWFGK